MKLQSPVDLGSLTFGSALPTAITAFGSLPVQPLWSWLVGGITVKATGGSGAAVSVSIGGQVGAVANDASDADIVYPISSLVPPGAPVSISNDADPAPGNAMSVFSIPLVQAHPMRRSLLHRHHVARGLNFGGYTVLAGTPTSGTNSLDRLKLAYYRAEYAPTVGGAATVAHVISHPVLGSSKTLVTGSIAGLIASRLPFMFVLPPGASWSVTETRINGLGTIEHVW